ncbi:WAS/WASL-interacting protein family member 3-like [Hordeum vulgare]|uniref:Uncharacterized protein n=1 Tax=Hordeum vulgare subsp. vulgare TaxID=112509 RepID=A0A8I6WDH9_HORVV|nr:anther-specific protein RTS-like [Hordeum vulgare subsp. vulgare]KAE8809236.1 WAS/WASL-interacting protein family member 3-like [Hordeum vulgare]KAI4965776.1 hypothetical protein ZWY2020_050906 [Hordeum vulgare]KAI5018525.1 hypothetical protein ZWY2020_043413 [Hordeum vulgare]
MATTSCAVLIALIALAGLADLQAATAAARPVHAGEHSVAAMTTEHPMADVADPDLNGMMQCMFGCFTSVMSCAFGCMGKGPDLPLCVISCNQKSIVCMIRCGITPSPPGPNPPTPPSPKPPGPKPPAPKPTPPKPTPAPGPPPFAGQNTETSP